MYFHFRIKNNFFRIIYTLLIISATLDSFAQAISKNKQPNKDKLKSAIQSQPILFLENQGQMTDLDGKPVPFVLFRADAPGLNLYITSNGLTYTFIKAEEKKQIDIEVKDEHKKDEIVSFGWERVDMELKGAIIKRENIVKKEESENSFNYFLGHCPNGIYGVKKYQKIIIEEVYPGIDWVLYNSSEKGFKYDFIVHPGADYRNIQLQYSSRQSIFLNENGELEIETEDGKLTESKPISYYKGNTIQTNFSVTSKELINIKGEIGIVTNIAFSFPNNELTYLTSDLIIDPTLFWATFIGAGPSLDGPFSVTSDASGNAFITGYTSSMNFPTQNSGTFFQGINGGPRDVFISKFNSACNMVWSTYYGGSFSDNSSFITTDVNGNIFITGETGSANFPLQNAGTYFQSVYNGGEAFILKFSNSGIRLWATLYGGTGSDGADCITLDATGNVFITGRTTSTDFPLQNAGTFFQSSNLGYSDAFIVKFDNFGNRLWATYYGGNSTDIGHCITADLNGNIFITGHTISTNFPLQNAGTYFQPTYGGGYGDAFIIKFTNQGTRLWSTYYGGSTDDRGFSIMSDASGNVFVGGSTNSVDFSTQNGGTFFQPLIGGQKDVFILKFNNSGARLWATYIGGNGVEDQGTTDNLVINSCGNVYYSFNSTSNNLTLQNSCDAGYFDNSNNGGIDNFLMVFTNNGILLWSTFIGGDGGDHREALALDQSENLFMTGEWTFVPNSQSYPLTNPGFGAFFDPLFDGLNDDGYVLKFNNSNCLCNMQAMVVSTSILCYGQCSGASSVIISGGTGPYTYSWSPSGQTGQIATNLCAGIHTVTITDAQNAVITKTISIAQPPAITSTIVGNEVNCFNNGTASVNVSGGTPGYAYVWNPSGQTNSLIVGLTGGTYSVIVTDANGCLHTQTVFINTNNVAPTNSVSPANQVVNCSAMVPVTFSGTVSNPTINIKHDWYSPLNPLPGGVPIATSNNTISLLSGIVPPGVYTLVTTNLSNGCKSQKTVTITSLFSFPTYSVASTTGFSIGCNPLHQTTLSIINPISTQTPPATTSYTFLPPGFGGVISPTVILDPNNTSTITQTPGTWTIIVQDNSNYCRTQVSVPIIQNTVAPNVLATHFTQTLTCYNPTVLASGSSSTPNTSITWNIPKIPSSLSTSTVEIGPISGPNTSTTSLTYANYTVIATNTLNACITTSVVQISQNFKPPVSSPTISIGTATAIYCTSQANPVVLTTGNSTTTSGGGALAFVSNPCWEGPSPQIPICGSSSYSCYVAGIYSLTIMDNYNGCKKTGTLNVIDKTQPPVLSESISIVILNCGDNNANLISKLNGDDDDLRYWFIDFPLNAAFNPTNATIPNGSNYLLSGTSSATTIVSLIGKYEYLVTNTITGCQASGTFIVNAGKLNSDFIPDVEVGFAPLTVIFTPTNYSGLDGITNIWSFGNGISQTNSTGISPVTVYNSPGTYTTMLISQKGSCLDTTYKLIKVELPSKLETPNIFTPNGDGSNDIFLLKTANLGEINVIIFDRWGNKVYEVNSSTGNIAWEGKNLQGKECSTGVYFYVITASGNDAKEYKVKGNVSLFR